MLLQTMFDNAFAKPCFYKPCLTMLLPTMVNHGNNVFADLGQPWLTEVPFHKPMVDHGLEKLCQPRLTMI